MTIYSNLEQGDVQQAKSYINDMLTIDNSKAFYFSGYEVVDIILYNELKKHDALKIPLKYQGDCLELPKYFNELDFSLLIGNLLNNAIEANLKLTENNRYLTMKVSKKLSMLVITLANPIVDNFEVTNNVLSTTKLGQNHGIGTQVISDIIQKYQGTINYSIDKNQFQVKICINL